MRSFRTASRMFSKRIARFHEQTQQELEPIQARHGALTEELIDTLADVAAGPGAETHTMPK
jgi:hypothetical protein